jgi:hypothetical protein
MPHRCGSIDDMDPTEPTPDTRDGRPTQGGSSTGRGSRPGPDGSDPGRRDGSDRPERRDQAERRERRDGSTGAGSAPFGLPVLAELPELAGVLRRLVDVDRLLAEVIDTLVPLQDAGVVERTTGVGIDGWLSLVARRTGSDVRMLTSAVAACRRFPSLHHAFSAGQLSWAQLRAVALKLDRVAHADELGLDARIADAIASCEAAEPDALARMIGWAIAELTPPPAEEGPRPAGWEGFLHLQPRLDGSGGSFYGEADPVAFALLDATTAPASPPPVAPTRDGFAGPADPERAAAAARSVGRARLRRLLDHLAATTRDPASAGDTDGGGRGGDGVLPGTRMLLRVELDTLLGDERLPAQLLTTLAGGAMHVDAATARHLADAGGPLRLVVTDHGHVVGVGRSTRVPPEWLRDTILALHDTCSAPGCDRPSLTAQIDHAIPWEHGGMTDAANCAPLCAHDNRTKGPGGWHATGAADGTRRWHHPRSGLQVTTHPTTTRLPSRRRNAGPRPPDDPPHRARDGTVDRSSLATLQPPRPPPPDRPPPD